VLLSLVTTGILILKGRIALENVFRALKHKLKKEVVGAGCPAAHIIHRCMQHGAGTLSAGLE
jgi:hypothetical protein